MAKRLLKEKLVHRNDIKEELRLIKNSNTDYITPTGKIYKDYENNMFFPKSTFVNHSNGYVYCNITYATGQKQRRVHILVAESYIDNPHNYSIVMHKDNNKENNTVDNLQWGTISQNTKQAFDDGLIHNDKSWDDSQSIAVIQLDMNLNIVNKYGSVSEASRQTNVTKSGILYQCNHKIRTKPRCGYYFRFLSEYNEKGFVL